MNWPTVRISSFCITGSGGTPLTGKKDLYYGGNIPWVKSGELKNDVLNSTEETLTEIGLKESSAKWVPAGAILIAMYGATIGKTALLDIDATTNQAICSIIPNPLTAENRYLWYVLRSSVPVLLTKRVGGAQPNISQKIIRDTSVPLPPLSEQRRIVEVLDHADSLRKKRTEADAKAARILPALFYKMFGDPNRKDEDGFESLVDCAEIIMGQSPPGETYNYERNGLPFFQGKMDFGSVNPSVRQWCSSPTRIAEPGDILLSVRAPVGPTNIANIKCAIGRGLAIIRPIPERSTTDFLFYSLRAIENDLVKIAQGSTFTAIRRQDVEQIRIPSAGIKTQNIFSSRANTIQKIIEKGDHLRIRLETIFKVLIHHAFSGDLTAKWREAHMKELLAEMKAQAKVLG